MLTIHSWLFYGLLCAIWGNNIVVSIKQISSKH
jgi:hypothetical protein